MPISVRVNVEEIDKRKLYEGKKGTYLDLILWEAEGKSAQYGDYIVKQAGKRGDELPILGNAKKVSFDKKRGDNDEYDQRRRDDREGPDDRREDEQRRGRKDFF